MPNLRWGHGTPYPSMVIALVPIFSRIIIIIIREMLGVYKRLGLAQGPAPTAHEQTSAHLLVRGPCPLAGRQLSLITLVSHTLKRLSLFSLS